MTEVFKHSAMVPVTEEMLQDKIGSLPGGFVPSRWQVFRWQLDRRWRGLRKRVAMWVGGGEVVDANDCY